MIVLQYADHRGRGDIHWLTPAARRERATNDSIPVMADTGRVQVLRSDGPRVLVGDSRAATTSLALTLMQWSRIYYVEMT
jgi:hypothetical protein